MVSLAPPHFSSSNSLANHYFSLILCTLLSDLQHQKRFGFYFSSWGSQFREVVGALVKSRSRSFGQRQQELWSKAAAGALVKSRSRSFGQRQQELWSKAAAGALVKGSRSFGQSSKSNGIGIREGED